LGAPTNGSTWLIQPLPAAGPEAKSVGTAGPKEADYECLEGQITPDDERLRPEDRPTPVGVLSNPAGIRAQVSIDLQGLVCHDPGGQVSLIDILEVTSSPIVVGCWLVFAVNYVRNDCPADIKYGNSILGLFLPDVYSSSGPMLHELNSEGGGTEGTLLFDPVENLIYWPHLKGNVSGVPSSLTMVDALGFATVAQHDGFDAHDMAITSGCDSSGVLTPTGFVYGTTNPPGLSSLCNNTLGTTAFGDPYEKANCGAILRAVHSGRTATIDGQIDYDSHQYRSWVGGSVSADSADTLYVGNTSQYAFYPHSGLTPILFAAGGGAYHNDSIESHGFTGPDGAPLVLFEDRFGCQATRVTDADFDPLGSTLLSFDPGDVLACRLTTQGKNAGTFKSSVAGEVVVTDDGVVWVQYTANNYRLGRPISHQVYALDSSTMEPICEFLMPDTLDVKGTSFYQAPTLADWSRGYAMYSFPEVKIEHMDLQGNLITEIYDPWTRLMAMNILGVAGGDRGTPARCSRFLYDVLTEEEANHSPTLVSGANGDYVLVATDRNLHVYDQHASSPAPLLSLPLTHGNSHIATPVFHQSSGFPPTVFLLSVKGDLSIIPVNPLQGSDPDGTPVSLDIRGYGNAVWPRFRADNCGSGRPGGCP